MPLWPTRLWPAGTWPAGLWPAGPAAPAFWSSGVWPSGLWPAGLWPAGAAADTRGDTLDAEPYLVAWVEARCPELAGRVFPHRDGFQHAPPYLLYSRVSGDRVGGQKGPAGTSVLRVQLDVWSDRRGQARRLADRVEGTRADPGLNGFRGLWPLGPAALFVQSALCVGQAEGDDRPPGASDAGWYVASRDYRIGFDETLRAAP